MGRELKRVALDFKWPLKKAWTGFINPHYDKQHDCKHCDKSGSNIGTRIISHLWYTHSHVDALILLHQINNEVLKQYVFKITNARSLSKKFFNWVEYDKPNDYIEIIKNLQPLKNKVLLQKQNLFLRCQNILQKVIYVL